MERAIIFCRVSLDNQDNQRQINDCSNYCKNNNLEIVQIFKENIGGSREMKDRVEFSNMLDFCCDPVNQIDGVILTEVSRFGRRLSLVLNNIERLHKHGVYVCGISDNIGRTLNKDKTINNQAMLMVGIIGSIAELERKTTIIRTNSGIRKSIESGNSFGGLCVYGYYRQDKKFYINEDEAKTVKLVFDLYLQGNGTQVIGNILNEKGTPTRRNLLGESNYKWMPNTIYNMLTNKLYTGKRIYQNKITNEIIESEQPQIIDNEIFNKVQKRLSSHFNKIGINTKFEYILNKGSIKCGVCGQNYFPHKRSDGSDNTYKCLSTRYKSSCENIGIGINKLTDSVWYNLRRTDILKEQIKKTQSTLSIKNDITKLKLEITKINRLVDDITKNEKKLLDLYMDQIIDKIIYTSKYKELQNDKNQYIIDVENKQNEVNELIEFENKQNDLDNYLRIVKNSPEKMKELVSKIVNKIVIYPVMGGYQLTDNKQNKCVCVHLFLYTTTNPICYIIGQRSKKAKGEMINLIQPIKYEEFDLNNFNVVGDMFKIKSRIKEIKYNIKF